MNAQALIDLYEYAAQQPDESWSENLHIYRSDCGTMFCLGGHGVASGIIPAEKFPNGFPRRSHVGVTQDWLESVAPNVLAKDMFNPSACSSYDTPASCITPKICALNRINRALGMPGDIALSFARSSRSPGPYVALPEFIQV